MARIPDAEIEAIMLANGALPEEAGFHVANGLFFRRLDDGSVRVTVVNADPVSSRRKVYFDQTIDPESWASVVASVSLLDETYDRWFEALAFHGKGDDDKV